MVVRGVWCMKQKPIQKLQTKKNFEAGFQEKSIEDSLKKCRKMLSKKTEKLKRLVKRKKKLKRKINKIKKKRCYEAEQQKERFLRLEEENACLKEELFNKKKEKMFEEVLFARKTIDQLHKECTNENIFFQPVSTEITDNTIRKIFRREIEESLQYIEKNKLLEFELEKAKEIKQKNIFLNEKVIWLEECLQEAKKGGKKAIVPVVVKKDKELETQISTLKRENIELLLQISQLKASNVEIHPCVDESSMEGDLQSEK